MVPAALGLIWNFPRWLRVTVASFVCVMQCTEGGEHPSGPAADHPAPPGAVQACAQARHAHAHAAADAAPPAGAPSACAAAQAMRPLNSLAAALTSRPPSRSRMACRLGRTSACVGERRRGSQSDATAGVVRPLSFSMAARRSGRMCM